MAENRPALDALLDPRSPADAAARYYALYHDRQRTRLTLHHDATGKVDGFLVACRTGRDLFRPVVTFRATRSEVATELLRAGLTPGLPVWLQIPEALAPVALSTLELTDLARTRLYVLDADRFQPQINVMVQAERGPDGLPVFVVRAAGGQVVARAGLAWKSPEYAEVSVQVDLAARERTYGPSVLIALTAWLLEARLRPLAAVADDDAEASARFESVGYVDTGARELTAQAVLPRG